MSGLCAAAIAEIDALLVRMYSYLLGRPSMVRKEIFDVALPSPVNADGTRNRFALGQIIFIQLANLVGETMEKVRYIFA